MAGTVVRTSDRLTLRAFDVQDYSLLLADDVRLGLARAKKSIPCRHFYDADGSILFERICSLPEYYLPRAERSILTARADELARMFAPTVTLVDLGSGNSAKTRILIEAFHHLHQGLRYFPVDISSEMLEQTSRDLVDHFHRLEVHAVAGDYEHGLAQLQQEGNNPKLIVCLGSTIGNFDRPSAARFLARWTATMGPADRMLVGIDLHKDRAVLEPAYDDAAGVTAAFNLNLLQRINRELDGHFELDAFEHRSFYNEREGRIEMHLVSRRKQTVRIEALEMEVAFAAGESIHTEDSYKYTRPQIETLASEAGLALTEQWLDAKSRFSLNVFAKRGVNAS